MGSLQRVIPGIRILKVEQDENHNSLFVDSDSLGWDEILEAEKATNQVIDDELEIVEHHFESIEHAKSSIPNMRAMEDRISGKVRVVEVKDYDYAACKRTHAKNSRECKMFLVTSFSRVKESYEIRFEVGIRAKQLAIEISSVTMKLVEILGASLGTINGTVINLKQECDELRSRFKEISMRELMSISPEDISGIKFYRGIFNRLDHKQMMDVAGKLVRKEKSLAILGNMDEMGFVILARSTDLDFDSSKILREILKTHGGKGGGRAEFASGSVSPENLEHTINQLMRILIPETE